MSDDYYSILGVVRTATADELKERYRFLCHAYHPDKFPGESQRQHAENDFKRINAAYEVLSDPDLRASYDAATFEDTSSDDSFYSTPPINRPAGALSWLWAQTKEWGTVVLYAFVAFSLSAGVQRCSSRHSAPSQSVLRPTDESFIEWIVGCVITTKKGIIFDDRWKIEKGEISEFKVLKLAENPADKSYTATVAFRATVRGSGIQVSEAMIRYRDAPENKVQFVEFVPVSVSRIGN